MVSPRLLPCTPKLVTQQHRHVLSQVQYSMRTWSRVFAGVLLAELTSCCCELIIR